MRKLFLIASILCFSAVLFAQTNVSTPENIDKLLKTKTLVVLENVMISDFNHYIRKSVEAHWKLTDFEVVQAPEFEKQRKNENLSFLVIPEVAIKKGITQADVFSLTLLLGGDYATIQQMPVVASVPVHYADTKENYSYQLAFIVQFMQQHIKNVQADPSVKALEHMEAYNKNRSKLKDKKLYMLAEDLSAPVSSKASVKKFYKHDFEIVDREKMEELATSGDKNAAFMLVVSPGEKKNTDLCFKMIFDAQDGSLLYADQHMISPLLKKGFLKGDLKRIGK